MFDNVCKFLAETFTSDFATWLLGEPVPLTQLSPSELSLKPIRADALILLASDEVVLQVEFQTQPNADIPSNCLIGQRDVNKCQGLITNSLTTQATWIY